ncbi:hypothetical protein C1708_20875 [Streptomyces sp. DH-12]|nr:hypothetical protein C1708_20875 [Streptomyces sp. DH-12]
MLPRPLHERRRGPARDEHAPAQDQRRISGRNKATGAVAAAAVAAGGAFPFTSTAQAAGVRAAYTRTRGERRGTRAPAGPPPTRPGHPCVRWQARTRTSGARRSPGNAAPRPPDPAPRSSRTPRAVRCPRGPEAHPPWPPARTTARSTSASASG